MSGFHLMAINLAQNIKIPGYGTIQGVPGLSTNFSTSGSGGSIGSLVTEIYKLVPLLAVILAFVLLLWAGLQYLFAGGNKDELAKAQSRITWAIVGLVVILAAYFITAFVGQVIKPKPGNIPLILPGVSLVTTAHAQNPTPVDIQSNYGFGNYNSFGDFISQLLPTIFSIATLGVVGFFFFAAFKFLTSGGNKDDLGTAQKMITGAIIGLVILLVSFLVIQFLIVRLFGIQDLNILGIPKIVPGFL